MNTPNIFDDGFIDQPVSPLETQLQNTAKNFSYPVTPNLTGNVRQQITTRHAKPIFPIRRLAWVMMMVVLAAGILLMSVSPVRTTVVDMLRQGAIRVFLLEPQPNSTPLLTKTPRPAVSTESPRLASPQSWLTTPPASATPISARQTKITVAPMRPPVQVTLPAQLPVKPVP